MQNSKSPKESSPKFQNEENLNCFLRKIRFLLQVHNGMVGSAIVRNLKKRLW